MEVKIGSARIDENKKAKGGKAGDQTGNEVSTQNWYKHSKGWIVLRPISTEIGEKLAYDMQAACNNNNIGYDQGQRLTLYNIAKTVGFDCAKVKEKCETDCSALVRVCCAYAGIMVSNFRTTNEASVLMATGKFIKLTDKKYTDSSDYLMRGDILVTRTQGHTVIVLNNGKYAPEIPIDTTNAHVLVTVKSVWIRAGAGTNYPAISVAYKGDIFDYLNETENNFYKIKYKETYAYISKNCSKLTI